VDNVQHEIDQLYKAHFGRIVASLLYSSRDIDPETAEDIVHDAFSTAITHWRMHGVPLNSKAWIYKVCKNKALNILSRSKRQNNTSEDVADIAAVEQKFSESLLNDQPLALLFACAHPDLSPKAQVVITLKYVVNFKVEAIAKILGMTIDGIDKLLLRARQKIKDETIILEEPETSSLTPRLPIVHKILYLLFNEGYKSSWGKQVMREDLCEEALTMTNILIDSPLGNKDTAALFSLMLFNSARFKSRFSPTGELLDLEKQDRSLWEKDLIILGCEYLTRSQCDVISTYHLEASIACVHCSANCFEETDWNTIASLYSKLLNDNSNPFVELNFAIALYYCGRREETFEILDRLHSHPFLSQYYLLNTTLGKFHHLEGNDSLAKEFLTKAMKQTNFIDERRFIQRMMDGIDGKSGV
jgi:RNA polymerase sigma factor (sigma-70 family)